MANDQVPALTDRAMAMPPDEFVLVGTVVAAVVGEPLENGHPTIVLTVDADDCGPLTGWAAMQLEGQQITLDVRKFQPGPHRG